MDLPTTRQRRRALATVGPIALACAVVLAACGGAPSRPSPTGSSIGSPRPSPSAAAASKPPPRPAPTPTPTTTVRPTPVPTAQLTPRPTAVATPVVTPRPTPLPTPRPTPLPTARPTAAPTSAPVSQPSILTSHGSRSRAQVALTLDMGGRVGDAIAIVEWLVVNSVHTSVFMTGAMADNQNTDAGRRVLAIVDDHPELFTLANHSYTHADFRTLTSSRIRDELRRTEAAIAPFCGQDMRPFFRPPYGGYDANVLAAVGAAGYRRTVMWDIDTIDWRPIANDPPGPTADQMVDKVVGNAQNGSIVLLHLGGWETLAALPRIVAGLESAGYELVTLDEMLGT